MKKYLFSLLAMFSFLGLSAQHTHADGTTHAAHDEAGSAAQAKPGADHFTLYAESDLYELTLYYPEISAGKAAQMTLFVADVQSNRPVDKAELKITAAGNAALAFEVKAQSPGVYVISGSFPEDKIYMLNVQIAHPNGADLIGIEGLEVGKKLVAVAATGAHEHEHSNNWFLFFGGLLLGAALVFFIFKNKNRTLTTALLLASAWFSAPNSNVILAHGDDEHGPESGGNSFGKMVAAPKETQFLFEILTQPISMDDYHSTTTMFGTIVPSSGGLGLVVAPQSGQVRSVKVAVGQTVRAGQVLAVLQQNIGTAEEVGVASTNAGLALQMENARVRLTAAQREFDRLKKIEDLAAGKDLAAAEANLNAARAEMQTLEGKVVGSNTAANVRTVTLVAPISGVVGAFTLAAGEAVSAGQTIFTVINLSKVYVEAQVYDQDVPSVQSGNKFLVTCSTDDHKTAEVRLISQAQTMNPGNQSQRVLFEMDNPLGEFKIGEFVTVKALNIQTSRQISVPNAALTEINGKTAVFIKHGPEEFELAFVQTGEDDGNRTLILKGVEEQEKIVVSGAYEVKMMYLNQ